MHASLYNLAYPLMYESSYFRSRTVLVKGDSDR
jgi:hypothetical protein